ncbi:MAG: FtsX-like permease family protein [Deltaproteobacteria bacterium]
MNFSLLNVSIGYISKHGLQSFLLVLGIALGVALVVSVDLANQSANRSLALSTETLTGGFSHRITADGSGIEERLYRELTLVPGVRAISPHVEGYVKAPPLDGRTFRILGIDPLAGAGPGRGERSYMEYVPEGALDELLTEPGGVLVSGDISSKYELDVGTTLELEYGADTIAVRVIGIIDTGEESVPESLGGVFIADISTAQELLGKIGLLTYIDIAVDEDTPEGKAALSRIREILPAGARVERPGNLAESTRSMTRAFELNLLALSLLALFVGVFLIYNTVTFSVLQRREMYGTLRALGVTRRQVFGMVLSEALVIGLIGALAGLALGVLLGRGIVGLVTRTINDLYFTLTVTDFTVSYYTLLKGLLLGVAASVFAALIPAAEASGVKPAGAFRRSLLESSLLKSIPVLSLIGIALLLLGVFAIYLPGSGLGLSLVSLFLILLGSSFLVPLATNRLTRLYSVLLRRAGAVYRMAPGNIIRSISRTGVAIASLTIAVSVIVSVDIMIGSFRTTVADWLDYTLNADIFISMPSGSISGDAGIDPGIIDRLKGVPGVDRAATVRRVILNTPRYGRLNLVAVTEDVGIKNRKFLWSESGGADLWKKMQSGSVLVSESFANRNGIKHVPGAVVELPTDSGSMEFKISGVYYDYGAQGGIVLMSDELYREYWKDRLITSVAAFVSPGSDVGRVMEEMRNSISGRYNLTLRSNRGLKESAIDTFDRTFTITTALRILVVIVAFIGVLSSLMSLQLERAREFGVLRALGVTVSQLRRMTFLENGIIGLTAGMLSIPIGVVLSLILIYVVNLRSFGWTLEFSAEPRYFIEALVIALVAAVCAGIYPAFRIGKLNTASLMREE